MLDIHADIVSEYSVTSAGVRNEGDIEYALQFVREGSFGHPFVDGNKRTALNTVVVFYLLNGYRFDYDAEIRTVLKRFGTDAAAVDTERTVEYLRTHTEEIDLREVVEGWQDDLVQHGLDQLSEKSDDPND